MSDNRTAKAAIPSVDWLLRTSDGAALINSYGRQPVTDAVRDDLAALRRRIAIDGDGALADAAEGAITSRVAASLEAMLAPSLRPVFNL
ncbi:L-seryl-tRNA(Sec) selenium transferase, partial [Alphaproteobacteria bacterium]|nr:L-seryl-tRNA(Sec) selenium transferase [Alphaproteobacteria bacterium]